MFWRWPKYLLVIVLTVVFITALLYFTGAGQKITDQVETIQLVAGRLKTLSQDLRFMRWLGGFEREKIYLVFFQNTSELRPTGGFWGSYGILRVKSGAIQSIVIDDIYHLDDAVLKAVAQPPPKQLAEYLQVERWFMRDLNWSPDFGEAGRLALMFYSYLNRDEQVDGVIAITPGLVEDLLAQYGSLEIEGQNYAADNFLSKTQYEVSVGYQEKNISSWERKEFLQQLTDQLVVKIAETTDGLKDLNKWHDLWLKNMAEKNILLYSAEPWVQAYLVKNNWAGTIRPSTGDYLMVVDANLASLKTDPEIERQLSYKVTEDKNGAAAETELKYIHRGSFNWRTTRYRTYVRVYVPLHSELQLAKVVSGNDQKTVTNEVEVTIDHGKTVFGYFISTEPGQTQSLILNYKLPNDFSKDYVLLWQKQPGAGRQSISVEYNGQAVVAGMEFTKDEEINLD